MKKLLLAASLLSLAIVGWLLAEMPVQKWDVRANEYFGDGVMWTVNSGQRTVGAIRAWGWYAIYGSAEGCSIVPLWSPVGDAATVPCGMTFNDKTTVFRGWYDFRGHPRPFCGALTGKGLPEKCFGEY